MFKLLYTPVSESNHLFGLSIYFRLMFWGSSTSTGQVVRDSIDGGNVTVFASNVGVQCIEINPTGKMHFIFPSSSI